MATEGWTEDGRSVPFSRSCAPLWHFNASVRMAQPPVRLDFDMGGGRTPKPQPGAPRDRPWRKSAAAVAAERQEVTDRHSNPPLRRSDPGFARCQARRLLGASGGVDLAALRYALAVQEAIDAAEAVQAAMHDERCPTATQLLADAQQAATALLQAATNACRAEEVAAARAEAERAIEAAGLTAAVATPGAGHKAPALHGLPKLQLLHQVGATIRVRATAKGEGLGVGVRIRVRVGVRVREGEGEGG